MIVIISFVFANTIYCEKAPGVPIPSREVKIYQNNELIKTSFTEGPVRNNKLFCWRELLNG